VTASGQRFDIYLVNRLMVDSQSVPTDPRESLSRNQDNPMLRNMRAGSAFVQSSAGRWTAKVQNGWCGPEAAA
jgi:hypothetical protein